jgi:hypothetical protein
MWERFRALGNTIFEMRGAAREAGKARTQALRAAAASSNDRTECPWAAAVIVYLLESLSGP